MLDVTLGSLYVNAQGCVPVLLENLCGMSCSETYWLLGGEEDRDEQEEYKGDPRGERQIYTVLCCLSVLRSPEHPQRFTELD